MFETVQELKESLIDAGVSQEGARFLTEHAKHTVLLRTETVQNEAEITLGETKIGGSPDLPADMAWPIRPPYPNGAEIRNEHLAMAEKYAAFSAISDEEERYKSESLELADAAMREAPLSFIAQVNLAAVAAIGHLDSDLPREGRFLVFYDTAEQPWGYRPGDAAGARVVFDQTPASGLVRTPFPTEIAGSRLEPLRCALSASLICESGYSTSAKELSEEDRDALWSWEEQHVKLLDAHRVGGYPLQIQDDMARQCVLVSKGIDCGGHVDETRVSHIDITAECTEWVFLFQIASEEEHGMMWGDLGKLYVGSTETTSKRAVSRKPA